MRVFKNCKELIQEIPREIFTRGINVMDKTVQGKIVTKADGFEQKELYGFSYILNSFKDRDEMMQIAYELFSKEHLKKEVAEVWFSDMLTNQTLKENWWNTTEYTREYFNKFCKEAMGEASYSYGERIIPQIDSLIKRLTNNLYARGAYISIHDNRDIHRIGRRIPCTLSYGFSVRNTLNGNEMNMFLHQRSQDAINFMCLDIYKASLLLEYIAKKLNVKPGKMIVYVDSLHAYHKDVPKEIQW